MENTKIACLETPAYVVFYKQIFSLQSSERPLDRALKMLMQALVHDVVLRFINDILFVKKLSVDKCSTYLESEFAFKLRINIQSEIEL